MQNKVFRIYVERLPGRMNEAESIFNDLTHNLLISGLTSVRFINRYDAEGLSDDIFDTAKYTVFSEPQTDSVSDTLTYGENDRIFAVEYLPGQFDQRADSCSQCIQILSRGERPLIRTAKIYILSGKISDEDFDKIKHYMINPVESREASLELPETLDIKYDVPAPVAVIDGFIGLSDDKLAEIIKKYSLAMDIDDIKFCQNYFKNDEKRDPTISEIRVIDSYWSDHCRHTTFLTSIDKVTFHDSYIQEAYNEYLKARSFVLGERKKDITLMDIGTVAAKYLKKKGILKKLDESDEINACSVYITVATDHGDEEWLLQFKNETHNHPTEIEPFGGAATCLGGAIRDPLSGRAYVYQAMRVTGAADPRVSIADTLSGKLPQSKLTLGAASGYSSYGNQIGLATGGVYELYHPKYVAKRLEIGAVVGAVPAKNVVRTEPVPGDVIILLGGRTGRDGCGGATGSSKAHNADSINTCGAEVQKGNPPEERKIQRLFRNPDVTLMIKRCNDFGAGGVSVAIGELVDGLSIDLSKVPKKYEGLDGTELAISESQERMAVVVAPENADKFIKYANAENLEATVVANVTEEPRLNMFWNGSNTVSLSREFLNSNGAKKHTEIEVSKADTVTLFNGISEKIDTSDIKSAFIELVSDLNVCSQKGLSERFDSSIGAGTVVMPFGGKNQLTAPQFMAAKIPVLEGTTETASVMAYGFNPYLSDKSPYHGALYAVVESVAKLVAAGCSYENAYLTFQEYFESTRGISTRWGKPMAALLGAFTAQLGLSVAAIGGKDSMSGSFEKLDVPPTLVSFAITTNDAGKIITPEFKSANHKVYFLDYSRDENGIPNFESLTSLFKAVHELAESGKLVSAYTTGFGGIAEAIVKMSIGNDIGFNFTAQDVNSLFTNKYGSFIIECSEDIDISYNGITTTLLGTTSSAPYICLNGTQMAISELASAWKAPLESVFPLNVPEIKPETTKKFTCNERPVASHVASDNFAKPKVIIPVFPGTNCEYDTMRRFKAAGADAKIFVLRNLSAKELETSITELSTLISNAQILMLPGGFSGGDEPDGSGKFITAVLRSPAIKDAVTGLIEKNDGLVLGICNGFQALVKSGLLPFGRILDRMPTDAPTLTFNSIGRHQSMMVRTRIASVKSPWLANVNTDDIHLIPISHGEGRFTAPKEILKQLADNGQIATQYVDFNGNPTMDIAFNPNASDFAIEGILSPDGRIFGKMGHSERTAGNGIGNNIAKNVPGNQNQKLFESGVEYFK